MSNDRKKRAERAEQMRKQREKADKRQRNVITTAIIAVVIVLVGAAAYGISTMSSENQPQDWSVAYTPEDAGAEQVDSDYEPVVVELYEDFACPACAAMDASFGEPLKAMVAAGDIVIEYHPFSFLDERGGSPNHYSKRATNAAICVYEEYGSSAFVDYHSMLFANQPTEGGPGPEDDALAAMADSLGYTGLTECIADHTYYDRIKRAKEAGGERGVTGTPTVFIDGTEVADRATLMEQITAAVAEKRGVEAPAPEQEPAPTS